jgi:GST-like protein
MPATQQKPIELHFWPTPNGKKISIMLEELGVPYEIRYVNIGRGDQFQPDFLAISPNNKIPAIVDPEGPGGEPISVFESGAILMYLGRKFGRFYPVDDERKRVEVEEWLMWQMASFGPMLGQNHHFRVYAPEKLPYAIKRYEDETYRLYRILNQRLDGRDYVCGEYSIADMAIVGWADGWERQGMDLGEFPNVRAWLERVKARPAVAAGMAIGQEVRSTNLAEDKEAQKVLFNQR